MICMDWKIILILTSFTVTVHSQTWVGTYNLDSACNTVSCCCLSNQMVITRPSTDVIAFNTSLSGNLCMGTSSYTGESTYPTGYTISASVSIITLTITLNSNSSVISITSSLGAACSSTGVRVGDAVVTTTTNAVAATTTTRNNANNTASANQKINFGLFAGFVTLNMMMHN